MEKGYNLYNLVENFKKWLVAEKTAKGTPLSKATLKNYTSDLRHFLGWSVLKLKVQSSKLKVDEIKNLTPQEFLGFITKEFIEEYKQYLASNKIPLKTVNRRLSTLRKFFSFCIDQGWIEENPAKRVKNQVAGLPARASQWQAGSKKHVARNTKDLINEFKKYLISKKIPDQQISTIITDVKEFLGFAYGS